MVEFASGLGGQKTETAADALATAALEQVDDDVTVKVEEVMGQLTKANLALHGDIAVEKMAHVCALMNNVCL